MNPEDVGRILDEIGERIGPAGAYAWEITVRQVVIEGWVWGVASLVVALVVVIAIVIILLQDRWEHSEAAGAAFITLAVGFLFLLVVGGMTVTTLFNPEYHAMIRLLERIVP